MILLLYLTPLIQQKVCHYISKKVFILFILDKDFNATIIYFEIPGDNTQFTIPLFLFQDMINEHKEGFVVILEEDDSGNFNNPFIDFNTTVAIVQINDDDGNCVNIWHHILLLL